MIATKFLAMFSDVTWPRRRAFLAAYVQSGGNIRMAKKTACGGSRHTVWLRSDPIYRVAFDRAKRIVAEAAERDVCRRSRRIALSNARLMEILRTMRSKDMRGLPRNSR